MRTPKLFLALALAASCFAQAPNWVQQTPNSTWGIPYGWIQVPQDPVSNQMFLYIAPKQLTGTVSVTNGSPVVNWVSGVTYLNFQSADIISTLGTMSSVAISVVNSPTQLTMASNYTGTTGTVSLAATVTGIFSKAGYFYSATTNNMTKVWSTDAIGDYCPADVSNLPGDSHRQPDVIDTNRGLLWLGGGVIVPCSASQINTSGTAVTRIPSVAMGGGNSAPFPTDGSLVGKTVSITSVTYTVASVTDQDHITLTTSAGTQSGAILSYFSGTTTNPREDLYYVPLNSNPASDVPVQVFPAHFPGGAYRYGKAAYDSTNDVIFLFSGDLGSQKQDNWVYCSTRSTASPYTPSGVLTTAQKNAGCGKLSNDFGGADFSNGPDDWSLICPGSFRDSNATCGAPPTQPQGVVHAGLIFDPITGLVFMTGGQDESGTPICYNQVWTYGTQTVAWNQLSFTGAVPGALKVSLCGTNNLPSPSWTLIPGTSKIKLHQGTDFQGTQPSDWTLDTLAQTWTLEGTGSGPAEFTYSTYDLVKSVIITYGEDVSNATDIWQGAIAQGASISVPLTIQEELPLGTPDCSSAGSCGVARTNEPFTRGVPLPDNPLTGTDTTSVLGLTGCSAGQFRPLLFWPSGRIKWVEVSGIVPSLSAGGTATCTLVGTGSGNFGGSDLATDGTTISVATGTSTFGVRKAHFNLLDTVSVGATAIVTTSTAATRGLVVTGPANPATDCSGGCTTAFSSENDAGSTCTIEENGPVKAVLKCTGDLIDGSSHVYMHHTTRLTFWKNKDSVKVVNSLRNADDNSSTFNKAYKGFAAYEAKLDIATSTPNVFEFGGKSGAVTGTISGSNNAVRVQQFADYLEGTGIATWNTSNIADNTTQSIIPRSTGGGCTDVYCYPDNTRVNEGYTIKNNTTSLETGGRSDHAQFYCNTQSSGGVGVLQGVWYGEAYWPKSCELNNGGSNLTIGIWPKGVVGVPSTFNYWIAWPQYQTHTFYYDFHTSALGSDQDEFLKLQYPLIARVGLAQLNASGVLPQGMILPDPTAEDNFYKAIATQYGYGTNFACCVTDTSANAYAQTTRIYGWGQGSADNQADLRWAGLILFDTRGFTSRYVKSEMFSRFVGDNALPRSDFAGGWRGSGASLDITGFPNDSSTNSSNSLRSWIDRLHAHIYGTFDWYGSTGDEWINDDIQQGFYDWLSNTTLVANTSNGPQRAIGVLLMGTQHLHDFALALPTPNTTVAANAWTNAEQAMDNSVRPFMNTYNAATAGNPCAVNNCAGTGDYGSDIYRGVTWPQGSWTAWDNPPSTGSGNPGGPGTSRNSGTLQIGIMAEGITEYLLARGPSLTTYEADRDLILGNDFFVRNEWTVTGQTPQINNGTRAGAALDYCNDPAATCNAGTHNTWAVYFAPNAEYWTWIPFSLWYGDNTWVQSFRDNLNQDYTSTGCANMSECGIYSMATAVYRALNTPSPLSDVTPTGFTDNGGGSYTLGWTVPASTTGYLFKWAPQPITYNPGFDNGQTMTFAQSPSAHTSWWGATNVGNEPAPATPGTTQTYTFSTGVTGLTVNNFALKAMAPSSGGAAVPAGTVGSGVSGSGVGQQ